MYVGFMYEVYVCMVFLCMRFYVCMRFQASLGSLGASPPFDKGRLLYLLFTCIDFPLLDISYK